MNKFNDNAVCYMCVTSLCSYNEIKISHDSLYPNKLATFSKTYTVGPAPG